MITVTHKTKEKSLSRKEYITMLERYFILSSEGKHDSESDITLAYLNQSLKKYREKNIIRDAFLKMASLVVMAVISSFGKSLFVIWAVNKVFDVSIEYSMSNVLIIFSVYFISKIKLGMSQA
jgi:hypothetical protein